MRNIIKKSSLFTLIFALIVSTALLCAGCKDEKGNNDNKTPSPEVTLTLDKDRVPLVLGDEAIVNAVYADVEGARLEWNSSDVSVATVDNGRIVSAGVGTAIISVTYADKKAECEVTVSTGDMLPVMTFEGLPEEETVTVGMLSELNFIPTIKFNGKTFTDAEIETEISDETIGRIEDGIFYPLKKGETRVEISGVWRGQRGIYMRKSFIVKVINDLSVVVNGGRTNSLTLYTASLHGGKNYDVSSPFVVDVNENGVALNYSVTVSNGVDVVAYNEDDKTVSALKYGEAEITISFVDGDGENGSLIVPVTVLRPVAKYESNIEYFSAADGDFAVEDVFGKSVDITDAYYDGASLAVEDNKIIGVPSLRTGMVERTLTVYDDTVGYIVTFETYTKVLTSESDLKVFDTDSDGYYTMKEDVVCSGTITITNNGKFTGVFDGNGYLIKNAKFSADASGGGLFGIIGNNAIIRNVGIIDADLSPYNSAIFAGCSKTPYNAGALIENVYVKVAKVGSRPGVLMWQRCPWDIVRNVIIDASCFATSGFGTAYGTMFASDNYAVADSGQNWAKNVANIQNVYVIAKEGVPLSDNVSYSKNYPAKIYASNDGKTENPSANEYVYTGVKRYGDLFALAGAINKIGDDKNYWTITETTVEWKGELVEFETKDYDKIVDFSVMDGDLPVADIFGNENAVITEAYQGGTALNIVNNKVLGVVTKRDGVTETSIVVVSASGKYRVSLRAYTKIIRTESDFSVFDVSNGTVDGYYVLGGDVLCQGAIEWKNASANKTSNYFNGIFDGCGHKVIGLRVGEMGLFGSLGNDAVIKDVAFTDSILSDVEEWKYTPFIAYDSAAGDKSASKIENVYIQFKNFREAKGGNRGAGLLFNYNSNITIKDVIIEIKTTSFTATPQFGYGALFAQDKIHGAATNLINVKVVSTLIPMAMITDVNLDTGVAKNSWATYAGNDKDAPGKLEKEQYYYYDGVNRYDDLAGLASATEKVGSWEITSDTVTWEENA